MANQARITPCVLKWARKSAKKSRKNVATELSVSVAKIHEWEMGTSLPTIGEAQLLAKIYKRPLAVLFLPSIPKGFRVLQDC
ncbi:helix-turn-helix transcriptional regulator [Dyadobacter luticola]|uniref:Helix-turn-helix transcriptional regulator n=1 Tax=Dyadobacter luticola TaxID=1979387 RepID=A0A5R9L2Y5_9BACT|nr:helix-turn-helix transcriptional regulator [Dyadobacter luticola]